jgi:hypothetical protein
MEENEIMVKWPKKIFDQLTICFYYKNEISNSPQIGTKLMHGNPTLLSKSARFAFNAKYILK